MTEPSAELTGFPMTNPLEIVHLSKSYDGTPVLRDVSLSVRGGRILTLLGPSGCGKTTTLRLIAGFDWPDSGTVTINGRTVASEGVRTPAEERRVGMVFQEYALFPHLTVAENIAFGLKGNKHEKQTRVSEMLALVALLDVGERMPYDLSGGQQQRIALARALAPQPDILLLDEPFSNLDAALRGQVRSEVRAILKQSGITCVFVTHDQEEALSLADEVAVMLSGHIAQVGTPQRLYRHPATRTVAAFVGEANFLPGEAHGETVDCVLGCLPLNQPAHGSVTVLIRPEWLKLNNSVSYSEGTIMWQEFYGHDRRLGIRLSDGTALVARSDADNDYTVGESVEVGVDVAVQTFPHQ
ncbi:MAG: ABC transporter ATP-binding protein [Anaerolineae bacterium]|nr:ABC transporter ATP-binding protein [Anaerolineae bacterium]